MTIPVLYNFGNSWSPVQAMNYIMAAEKVQRPHYEVLLALYECITHGSASCVYVRCVDSEFPPSPKECSVCNRSKCYFKFIGYMYAHECECELCEVAVVIHYTMTKEQYENTPVSKHNAIDVAIAKNYPVLNNFVEALGQSHTLVKSARKT